MATKTFKIGESCRGGIITAKTTKSKAIVIAKEWDMSQGTNRGSNQSNAKEWDRLEVDINDSDAYQKLREYLWDLTTSYYTDQVLNWFENKVTFKNSFSW
jgi:hypothetical protein